MMDLKIKLCPGGKLPVWVNGTENAGLDLYCKHGTIIHPGDRAVVPLGIVTAFGPQYVAVLKDRSGLAAKRGLTVLAGVIDASYRGEWGAILYNSGNMDVCLTLHERVCQAIFVEVFHPRIQLVDELPQSLRNDTGFGASGTH